MRAITKYIWIAYTEARSNVAYAGELLTRIVFLTVLLYIFSRLWLVVYGSESGRRLAGFTLCQMLWYLVVTEAVAQSTPRTWAEVDQDVRTGRISVQLIRPLSYVFSHFSRAMGERSIRFSMNMLVGSAVAWLLVGPIHWTLGGLFLFSLVLPLAFALEFLGSFAVGLCAFWLENTSGLALIYSRLTLLLGGVLLPMEIYPERLQPFLKHLPFASMAYGPGRMFVNPGSGVLTETIGTQVLALLVFVCVVGAIQRVALKRVFANGG